MFESREEKCTRKMYAGVGRSQIWLLTTVAEAISTENRWTRLMDVARQGLEQAFDL